MRRPNSATTTYRDESISAKWNDIKDWERSMNGVNSGYTAAASQNNGFSSQNNGYSSPQTTIPIDPPKQTSLTAKEKLIQFKKQSTRRLVNIKNTISGKYKRAEESQDDDIRSEVSTSPSGNTDRSQHSLPTSCAPTMRSFSNVGRGIKASKSLQNLEQITKDGWRQMADRTSYLGQNIKHRCSSKVDINKLAPKMNYESLNCDEDSDEENRPSQLF